MQPPLPQFPTPLASNVPRTQWKERDAHVGGNFAGSVCILSESVGESLNDVQMFSFRLIKI